MNIEFKELVDRLNNLIALCKKKKYNLAKPEKDETFKVLSSLISLDSSGFDFVMNSLSEIPSEIGANLLYDSWTNLIGRHNSIYSKLQDEKYSSDLGKRLRLALARKLLEKDPKASLRILIDVCLSMRPEKQIFPTSDDLKLINSTLLKKGVESLSILPLHECGSTHLTLVLNYLLGATFIPKEKNQLISTFETQAIILKWINTVSAIEKLPSELQNAITSCVKKWDSRQKGIMQSDLNSFSPVFKQILEPVLTSLVETEDGEKITDISTFTDVRKQQSVTRDITKESDILDDLERFSNQVRNLVSELQKAKSDFAQVDSKLKNALSEVESLQRESDKRKEIIEAGQEHVKQLSLEKTKLIEVKEALGEALEKAQAQSTEIDSLYKKAMEAHSKEIDYLSERMVKESDYRIISFCNRLATELHDNVVNYKDAMEMDMTLELGRSLRGQLGQLLKLLKKEGINLDGVL